MRNRQQKELRRLEEALMEAEYAEENNFDKPVKTWQQTRNPDCRAYNTDETDVDLEEYSQEVYEEHTGHGLGVVATMLVMVLLSLCILLLLKLQGVL